MSDKKICDCGNTRLIYVHNSNCLFVCTECFKIWQENSLEFMDVTDYINGIFGVLGK